MLTSSKYIFGLTLLLTAGTVAADYYEGKLSYGDGLYATESWANPATSISWIVTNEDPLAPEGYDWKYTYILSVPKKDISHIIVEASNGDQPFTEEDLADVVGTKVYEVGMFAPDKSNPFMPADLYGVKFDDLSDTDITISFYSDRAPVWGDFYAKDGKDRGKFVLMYNEGFEMEDPVDPPSSGSISGHLLRPDSYSNPTPEPGVLILLGVGGLGLLRRQRA